MDSRIRKDGCGARTRKLLCWQGVTWSMRKIRNGTREREWDQFGRKKATRETDVMEDLNEIPKGQDQRRALPVIGRGKIRFLGRQRLADPSSPVPFGTDRNGKKRGKEVLVRNAVIQLSTAPLNYLVALGAQLPRVVGATVFSNSRCPQNRRCAVSNGFKSYLDSDVDERFEIFPPALTIQPNVFWGIRSPMLRGYTRRRPTEVESFVEGRLWSDQKLEQAQRGSEMAKRKRLAVYLYTDDGGAAYRSSWSFFETKKIGGKRIKGKGRGESRRADDLESICTLERVTVIRQVLLTGMCVLEMFYRNCRHSCFYPKICDYAIIFC
ncbi:hypothetical protein ACRALDRAFT_2018416 [Sodiomyces alcalophilus JCM 7366]|uniref:uncharacterized protein n=1 Tax=Sodiomyces alcalophilus JCM 7366 TaxID=591952 RepID=UPI0039B68306